MAVISVFLFSVIPALQRKGRNPGYLAIKSVAHGEVVEPSIPPELSFTDASFDRLRMSGFVRVLRLRLRLSGERVCELISKLPISSLNIALKSVSIRPPWAIKSQPPAPE